jgi:hypothetical protein
VDSVPETRRFIAEVEEVHSGDDLVLMVDLGIDNLFKKVRARLHGVDTPDAYKLDSDTDAGKIRDKVKEMVKGRSCCIELHAMRRGGWIVTLLVRDKAEYININEVLRELGFVFEG